MSFTHTMASGMSGVRGAGDLVARLQMSRGMKINEAKTYVADRLGLGVDDLVNEVTMDEVRQEMGLGSISPGMGRPKGIEAKFNIAEVLGIDINCVNKTESRIPRR